MNFVDSFYREFKQVPTQVYQVEQMYRLGHLTEDDAQELVFNLNLEMYLGDRLSSVGELQEFIKHRKRCA